MRLFFIVAILSALSASAQPRQDLLINTGWRTTLVDSNKWRSVDLPHNWDDYAGYRRLVHGNLHGSALYTKSLEIKKQPDRRYFLWFEGVGSYATVTVNGQKVGAHAGGRTTFTLDITHALKSGTAQNTIEVRADHPANIRDLPWVCGGDSEDRGFSEGSQPFGIFRPVHLLTTNDIRVEPFGVHIWNDTTVDEHHATLYTTTEIKNYAGLPVKIELTQKLFDTSGALIATTQPLIIPVTLTDTTTVREKLSPIANPHLWSPRDPFQYVLVTELTHNGKLIDRSVTGYGIRRIHWVDPKADGPHPFTVNGKPVFLNGIAEYEHRIGNSHAFTRQEIRARVEQIKAAGFNAFRDAHQPHNIYYQHFWDSLGILWWPQYSAHIWFDNPEFRKNFKQDLAEWVKERRNSPSVILWGLQNESKLPADFAKECVDIIRRLDPTASSQRLIVTCNGGQGTDWDVPQNWTGTYGGDPKTYGADLIRQTLVGEYGAWRTADLHGDTANSEERMCAIMEQKIRLADSVKTQVAGHFAWLYASHDNPGRVQSGEGKLENDRIGPVNYKGLLTEWEEPLDPYYLYKSNFTSPETDPMVYIVSHTWPDRWRNPGVKSGIIVYSNCDTVELFNGPVSLGKRTRHGIGTHFQWDSVDIKYPSLEAVAHQKGQQVATDEIELTALRGKVALPEKTSRPTFFGKLKGLGKKLRSVVPDLLSRSEDEVTDSAKGYNYLYRVNCGGEAYTDRNKNVWLADAHYTGGKTWGSTSWTDDYKNIPPFFASQRTISDTIENTVENSLLQSFRYGLQKLTYTFPVAPGEYRVELYFIEPWLGTGSPKTDCSGWRQFDVAVNGETLIKNLDIWTEAEGRVKALKKVVNVHVTGNTLAIHFPHIASGQALISAIAIATKNRSEKPAPPSVDTATYRLEPAYDTRPIKKYKADTVPQAKTDTVERKVDTTQSKANFAQSKADTLQQKADTSQMSADTAQSKTIPAQSTLIPAQSMIIPEQSKIDTVHWSIEVGVSDKYALTIKYRWHNPDAKATLEIRLADGTLITTESVDLKTTSPGKSNYITTTTGTMINAGRYKISLIVPTHENLEVDELQVQ
jgi:hypothetical protein